MTQAAIIEVIGIGSSGRPREIRAIHTGEAVVSGASACTGSIGDTERATLLADVKKGAGYVKVNQQGILALRDRLLDRDSADRWALIRELENEIEQIEDPWRADLETSDIEMLKRPVDAHDMLMALEIEAYIKTPAGTAGLYQL